MCIRDRTRIDASDIDEAEDRVIAGPSKKDRQVSEHERKVVAYHEACLLYTSPEARIGFVHGQMSEVMLENTLLDFLNGDYDVLVATTIIETGIDLSLIHI